MGSVGGVSHGCPWNEETAVGAACWAVESGDYSVLSWAVGAGCPCDEGVCRPAARGNCTELLAVC